MSFWIKDDELLEKYNRIWDKVSNSIKNGFNKEPVYNERCVKTKMKPHSGKISTNFHDDGIPKEGFLCICLSVLLIDSAFKIGKKCLSSSVLRRM